MLYFFVIVISTFGMSNLILPYRVSSSTFSFVDYGVFNIAPYLYLTRTHRSAGVCFNLKNVYAVTRSSKSGEQTELTHKMMNNWKLSLFLEMINKLRAHATDVLSTSYRTRCHTLEHESWSIRLSPECCFCCGCTVNNTQKPKPYGYLCRHYYTTSLHC